MPAFTREQLSQMLAAVKSNNLVELDKVMLIQGIYSRSNLKQYDLCFKVACHFGLTTAVAKYREFRSFSEDILRIGLFEACKNGDIDTLKLLIEKGHVDPNKNFDISACHADDIANPAIDIDWRKKKEDWPEVFPLLLGVLCGKIEIVRYLAGLKNINLNKTFRDNNSINFTALLAAFHKEKPEIAKILLESGANPLIECEEQPKAGHSDDNLLHYSFYTRMLAMIANEDVHNPLVKMYFEEWYPKNKHREHELNVEAARIAGKHYSPEHLSSGANSPMSIGSANNSPNGSPPKPSAIVRYSPPDSPVVSRNGSPPSSPMQKSDSASSGSAGSSPEKTSSVSKPTLTPQQRAEALIKAMDGNAHRALSKAISAKDNDLEVQKILFNESRFKFMDVLEAAEHGKLDLLKYMIEKYPEFSSLSDDQQFSALHKAVESVYQQFTALYVAVDYDKIGLEKVKYLLDKGARINAQKYDGETPLHLAALYDSVEIVKELLKRGADPLITNKDGLTALQISLNQAIEMEEPQQATPILKQATEEAELKKVQQQQQVPPIVDLPKPIAKKGEVIDFQEQWLAYKAIKVVPPSAASPAALQAPNLGAKQVGTLYVSPPPSELRLPAKESRQNSTPNTQSNNSKPSLASRLKKLIG